MMFCTEASKRFTPELTLEELDLTEACFLCDPAGEPLPICFDETLGTKVKHLILFRTPAAVAEARRTLSALRSLPVVPTTPASMAIFHRAAGEGLGVMIDPRGVGEDFFYGILHHAKPA